MIGIILATHGDLGRQMLKTVEKIVAPLKNCSLVAIYPEERMEDLEEKFRKAVKEVDSEEGILILSDLFGGTASNISHAIAKDKEIRIVSGVNLPMLLELATHRDWNDLGRLASFMERTGRSSIVVGVQHVEPLRERKSKWRRR